MTIALNPKIYGPSLPLFSHSGCQKTLENKIIFDTFHVIMLYLFLFLKDGQVKHSNKIGYVLSTVLLKGDKTSSVLTVCR